jgi:hypothetical protein
LEDKTSEVFIKKILLAAALLFAFQLSLPAVGLLSSLSQAQEEPEPKPAPKPKPKPDPELQRA